jgi:hypothetical protein
MNAAATDISHPQPLTTNGFNPFATRLATGPEAEVFTDLYQTQVNLAIWQRELEPSVHLAAQALLESPHTLEYRALLAANDVAIYLDDHLPGVDNRQALIDDLGWLTDMFSCLLDLDSIGFRLATLKTAMCPKFHVDRVHCRMLTTYGGPGTEWLDDAAVDRNKLGAGCNRLSDTDSGLMPQGAVIHQLAEGEVGLLKGELWQDNEHGGLVHRSPGLSPGEKRLLLTLDCG